MDSLRKLLESVGQEHLLKFANELTEEQRASLKSELSSIEWEQFNTICKTQVISRLDGPRLRPVEKIDDKMLEELKDEHIGGTTRCSREELENYRKRGLRAIGEGKVAALLLAGGQGTRLGVDYPKGMFDIGLESHKSLYQLQAERILELIKLTSDSAERTKDDKQQAIIWYIMTSEATLALTRAYFREQDYFGLVPEQVVFFEQGTIPCLGFDSKVLLDEKFKISRSPDGNGGLYESLHKRGIIDHMRSHGVEFVHAYCVDNVLVRVCDPTFVGFCIERQVDTGAKVVEKVHATESVGTICKVGSRFKVIEYSEISEAIAAKRSPETGKLCFNAGNICEHFFRVDFLESIKNDKLLPYHLAIKKIPHIDLCTGERIKPSEPNGIKLEKFIFDVFEFTDKFVAWEVKREDEFSPLKNANGTPRDNPTSAREALLRAYELGILTY